jgi:hypothetical protein
MSQVPTPQKHWFAVRVEFTCPACKKLSSEVMYMSASKPDPDPIAAAAQRQQYSCRLCKVPLAVDGTEVNVTVLPVTLNQARAPGFNPPSGV